MNLLNTLTRDIFIEASNSSLSDIEKLLVFWPIWTDSPIPGAKTSFVMARMLEQLSMRASVALGEPCTIIYENFSIKMQDERNLADHLSGVDLRYDRLRCSSII